MAFNAFDVVVVPFPFTDREATKRRPALVVSNTLFNQQHDQLILAMITTSPDNAWSSDVSLMHWQEIGLKVACHVRLKLFTLDQNLVLKTVGQLTSHDVKSLKVVLAKYVGIN